MAIIRVDNISDIKIPETLVNQGSFGEIYPFGDGMYFKKLKSSQVNLSFLDNAIRLEILTRLMDLKGTENLILPKDIYVTFNSLIGYTTLIKKAKTIRNISLDTPYCEVIKGFDRLKKDIMVLANMHIFDGDIHQNNILFDGRMYLLDFDQSIYAEEDELIYARMLYQLFQATYLAVFKNGYGSSVLMEKDIEGLIESYKSYQDTNYNLFFNLLRWKLEYYTGQKVNTVGDVRRGLSLTKKG